MSIASITQPAPLRGVPSADRTGRRIVLTLAAWLAIVTVAAAAGVVARVPIQVFPALVAVLLAAPTVVYFRSDAVRAAFDAWGQRRVLIAHAWRIPAAITFALYGAAGLLPATFVRNAAWGDLLAGLLGLAVAMFWPKRQGFLFFHVFGFADFLVAVGTGFVLSVLAVPQMANIETFPLALIPLFGVALSGASHIASLAQLRAGRERA